MTNPPAQQQEPFSTANYSRLVGATNKVLILTTLFCLPLAIFIYVQWGLDRSFLLITGIVWIVAIIIIRRGLTHHGHPTFGTANTVTTCRAAGAILLTGILPSAHALTLTDHHLWAISLLVALLITLDGVDGYFARRENLESRFGARFDMEVDAYLALVIALLLWQSQRAGIWVLGLGLMRYLFVIWSWYTPALRAKLFPSLRRKTVCVIQLSALCLMLTPLMVSSTIAYVGVTALVCLTASFVVDIVWLYNRSSKEFEESA